jgi:sulfate permease, SulP family
MHAVFLGIFVAALASVVARLPMAALAAVLFMTAIRLIEVSEIRKIHLMEATEGRLAILTAALTVLVDLTVSVPVGLALTLLLVLRRMLEHGSIAVRERHSVHVADPGTQLTFLTSPRIRPQIDAALGSDTKPVQALDLSRVSAMDATGLSLVAEVMDRHPHLDVWMASAEKTPALQHAGVSEDRIHILGNGVVRLRDVLATIQSSDPTELAAAATKAR